MKNNEFYIGKTKYSIEERLGLYKEGGFHHYKLFKVYKDDKYWSAVEIGIPNPVLPVIWENKEIEEFLSEISIYIIKLGICNEEVKEFGGDRDTTKFLLCSNPSKPNQKKTFETMEKTLEYYKKEAKEAEKIDKHKIGFI